MARSKYRILHIPTGYWVAWYYPETKEVTLTRIPNLISHRKSMFKPEKYKWIIDVPLKVTFTYGDSITSSIELSTTTWSELYDCNKSEFEFFEVP